ncbi:MAG: divalent-cation tolerance protein CutA [Anaerolineales bacterium]|nr:divalent-cation tolerance protein CutA [Anaerolineales bacterium]MCX7608220.1 divalent-cation tolerance protein CutA [Anaerolineales bacterium]MDW8227041.1 divalent-cation tolerance protein CutA [Anaerolineales bacterium]
MENEFLVLLITAPNDESGREIARALVEKRLAACVNLLPGVTSMYHWEGKLQEDSEVLLICKTHRSRLAALEEEVKSLHPYQVPEIIALPVVAGLQTYLTWVGEIVQMPDSAS